MLLARYAAVTVRVPAGEKARGRYFTKSSDISGNFMLAIGDTMDRIYIPEEQTILLDAIAPGIQGLRITFSMFSVLSMRTVRGH